ncbi:MAG: poly-gamma-glutamate system protein [candidate division WOR-3 bacterium]
MRRRRGKVNRWVIASLALLALILFYSELKTARFVKARLYSEKLLAAQLSAQAFSIIKNYRVTKLELPIDSVNDPNGTGLIGLQYSPITYGRSDLSDALTVTNPNFSAALIELLVRAGVRANDTVAINWDGTYPALNVQVLAAVRTLRLTPVIVTAQSAGMWGANWPGFTWLELERLLRDAGIWDYTTVLATVGGEADDGRGISPEGRSILRHIADSLSVPLLSSESLIQAINNRMEVFRRCRLLIAVGLPVTNSGDPLLKLPTRIFSDRHTKAGSGIVAEFIKSGRRVIHIAKPTRIALDYRLPVAPEPLPEIGRGRLFFERRYSVGLAIVFWVILIVLLIFVVRYDIEFYLGVKSEEEQEAV